MASTISVDFPLKTNSAASFDDLMRKAHAETSEEFMNAALGWYRKIVNRFNEGCDILEIDKTETDFVLIDLFAEAANARTVGQLNAEIPSATAALLKKDFNSDNYAAILMNAHYFYDRVIDTESRGYRIAANDGSTKIITVYKLDLGS